MLSIRGVRAVALVVTAVLLVLGAAACGDDGGDDSTGLPAVDDTTPVLGYRILYRVTTPDASTTEELVVRRPFDARVVQRDADGEVLSERWSTLGMIVTRTPGEDAVSIAVAAAPALGDSRFDRMTAEMVAAGKLTEGQRATVGGRRCTYVGERTTAATLPAGADPGLTEAQPIQATVDRCVDVHGIVLEERWSSPSGQRLLTKRAAELDVDDELEVELPDAEPLSPTQGNGFFRPVDADAASPAAEQFELASPGDLTFVGRFEVAPPRLGNPSIGEAQLSLVTDVWTSGADLLLLDQGVGAGGATPFDDELVWRALDLPGFGAAQLAGDARMAEIRLTRPGGAFVRLAGTVPIDELEALAAALNVVGEGP